MTKIDFGNARSLSELRMSCSQHPVDAALEIKRLREGLFRCAELSGTDTGDGIPTWPDIVVWATREVERLRKDYDDACDQLFADPI